MSGPATICLKRKAGEDPPEQLVVQKRQISEEAGEEIRYTLKRKEEEPLFQNLAPGKAPSTPASRPSSREGRRTFHLARTLGASGVQKRKDGKRKRDEVLTVEEKRVASKAAILDTSSKQAEADGDQDQEAARPLKRPGKGSAVRAPAHPDPTASDDDDIVAKELREKRRMEALANDLHQFALAEIAKVRKPKITAVPKLSGARSREIHQQRMAKSPTKTSARTKDTAISGYKETDYVYDTYILAPSSAAAAATNTLHQPTDLTEAESNIGYLIISEDDESIWETFMDDEDSDKDFDTDDEDENAENYYGADYPEDELASDDEFDRGAYGYRRNGDSDNEEWDEETGVYSGDEEEAGWEREMNPFKVRGGAVGRGALY